ncbi:hypothetical protein GCM10009425_47920 [Pseudomonas asuensis]|uniref:Uncharacterized protein n=1 Tax=Pseudomonas asuensis TaxID=1825787 RepID=A0ABQ2H5Q3_9PSED|nr:hypothetical protein [Pseudomonas asuensis]GGM31737.1 hypothetical protein GCM10009425_47920 [Pseudomonas asuensis]
MRIPSLPSFSRPSPCTGEPHESSPANETWSGVTSAKTTHHTTTRAPKQIIRDGKLTKLSPQARRAESLARKGPVNVQLQQFQDALNQWDTDHPLDLSKVTQALRLVADGHDEKLGIGERSSKYSRARKLMREGCGIDQATYDKAKHAIGMQGLVNVYESAFTTLVLSPTLAAAAGPGADTLGAGAVKAVKYAALWAATPFSNGAGQIVVDGYQDMIAKFNGVPAFANDIRGSNKLGVVRQQISYALKEATRLHQAYSDPGASIGARREALDGLEACGIRLENLHDDYRKRVALGQSNFVKYETQIAYKTVTAPAVIAAGVFGGPFASAGALAAQQALQAPFGYLDEILLKDHIMRANTKYADVLTEVAKAAGKSRQDPNLRPEDLDPAKVRQLWTHPKEIVTANVNAVAADELAARLASLDKLDATIEAKQNKTTRLDRLLPRHGAESVKAVSPELRKLQARRANEEAELESLKKDIVLFKNGQWTQLHSGGTIAAMLLSSKEHFTLLTKAKFRRPGEYVAQVLDRHGGLSLPRTLFVAFEDGFQVSDRHSTPITSAPGEDNSLGSAAGITGSNPAAASLGQAGVLSGNAYTNPVAKFTKQHVTRRQLMPQKEEGEALRQKKTITGSKPLKADLRLQPQIVLNNGQTFTPIDLRQTRAWYMQSHSASRALMESIHDTGKSFATHLKAAATLPIRSARASNTDRQAKAERTRLSNIVQRGRHELELEALREKARVTTAEPVPDLEGVDKIYLE